MLFLQVIITFAMEIIRGKNISIDGPTVATIGTFDGVHIGHQKIIDDTVSLGKAKNLSSVLITFENHPRKIISPDIDIQALTTLESKIGLLSSRGLDYMVLLEFDEEMSGLSPDAFCQQILIDKLKINHLFVGENFRFGKKAAGNALFLKTFGQSHEFGVDIEPLLAVDGEIVSSTKIRRLIANGEMERVPKLLGRHFFISGIVAKGAGRGVKLGFPTANLEIDDDLCLPKTGVYAGFFWLDDKPHACVINVGSNPTFGPGKIHLEAFIFDFSDDIYGERVRVELQRYQRGEEKFKSVQDLIDQIALDSDSARDWLSRSKPTAALTSPDRS